jgi:hypothetical protein
MGSSPGFGSAACDGAPRPARLPPGRPGRPAPSSDSLSLGLRPLPRDFTPRHSTATRRLILQEARHQAGPSPAPHSRGPARAGQAHPQSGQARGQQPSDCVWAAGFRYSFTPLAGVLFTGPSRYWSTIGRLSGYVALERGRPRFPQGSSCPVVLTHPTHQPARRFGYGALTPSGRPSQAVRLPPAAPAGCPAAPPVGPCNPRRT